jgi:hypothetical protein
MKCKQAKTQVALLIGNDLDPTALQDVRNHLGQCVGCQQHFQRLSSCLEVLQAPPRSWNSEQESLWPKLSVRLASPNAGQKPHRLSGWAPALAVAAACTAMFWVASSQWPTGQSAAQPGTYNGRELQPVGNPPTFDGGSSNRKEAETRSHRPMQAPSGEESDTIPLHGPRPSAIPVVPVSEPTH